MYFLKLKNKIFHWKENIVLHFLSWNVNIMTDIDTANILSSQCLCFAHCEIQDYQIWLGMHYVHIVLDVLIINPSC